MYKKGVFVHSANTRAEEKRLLPLIQFFLKFL